MKVAVFGTGGVGGYFGGRLAEVGEDVSFIARGAHLQAIRDKGLRIVSVSGDVTIASARATDDPGEVGPVDLVIVGVKAWQIRDAATAMKPLIGDDTMVLPLENGVEAADILADVLGRAHVIGGLCTIVSMIEAPGTIRHAAIDPPAVRFGELDNRRTPRVERIFDAFERASGVTPEIPADIERAIWQKFVFIASWSGIGAVARAPIGAIRSNPQSRALLLEALDEAIAVGRARGVDLPDEVRQGTIAFYDSLAETGTASMQRDVAAGKPSELESQTGAIVRMGAAAGVPTPVNSVIYRALLPGEAIARGEA